MFPNLENIDLTYSYATIVSPHPRLRNLNFTLCQMQASEMIPVVDALLSGERGGTIRLNPLLINDGALLSRLWTLQYNRQWTVYY